MPKLSIATLTIDDCIVEKIDIAAVRYSEIYRLLPVLVFDLVVPEIMRIPKVAAGLQKIVEMFLVDAGMFNDRILGDEI